MKLELCFTDHGCNATMNEISSRTWWLLAAAVMAVTVAGVAVQAANLGFWQPWESSLVQVDIGPTDLRADADRGEDNDVDEPSDGDGVDEQDVGELDEAADSPAVPTLEGEPLEVSWLRAKWTSRLVDDEPVVETETIGDSEWRARAPLVALLIVLLGFTVVWGRKYLGDGPAAMTAVVLATTPVMVLGVLVVSGPLVVVAASAIAVMAFFHSVYAQRHQLLWALVGAVALAVVALDARLVGVVSTVAVVVGLAVAQLLDSAPQTETQTGALRDRRVWLWIAVGLAGLVALLAAGWWPSAKLMPLIEEANELMEEANELTGSELEEMVFLPGVTQLLWIGVPVMVLGSLAMAASRTPVGAALVGPRGGLFVAGGLAPLVWFAARFWEGIPARGEISKMVETGSPALGFLIEQHQFAEQVAAAGDFSWWWRQVGFGMFPHLMLLIPAVGFLLWKLRSGAETTAQQRAVALLCLVWPVAAFVVAAPAASVGHTSFPAFFPLVVAIGWMVADGQFWKTIRVRPGAYLSVAVVAIFTVVILTNDLGDFPARIVDFVLQGDDEVDLADDLFRDGPVQLWGRAVMVAIVAYFAGIVSWLVFARRDAARAWGWLSRLFGGSNRADDQPAGGGQGESDEPAGRRRMRQREQWRDSDGPAARIARRVERLPGLVALVTFAGVGFTAVLLAEVAENVDEHLSTRAVVETYLDAAHDDEPLYSYNLEQHADDFYTRSIEVLDNYGRFNDRYTGDERFFALVDTEDLARLHSRVRRAHGEHLAALAESGGLVLVTNRLEDGETSVNPIAEYVLDEVGEDYIELEVYADGQPHHPRFDDRIEFLGYRLDGGGGDETPVYSWGDTIEVTQYFRVDDQIRRDYDIFIHIDLGGNRIIGDHEPVGERYPTSHWVEGDIIKNVHEIEVERFETPGRYTMHTGFFSGDSRMSVEPEQAHPGDNRVRMTDIEIVAF